MPDRYLPLDLEAQFLNLRRGEYRGTSSATTDYNCIAHAADKNDNWWWPVGTGAYWPVDAAEETLDAFVLAYRSIGVRRLRAAEQGPGTVF